MILVIDLTKTRKLDIMAALCILTVIGQWHSRYHFLCSPSEIRKLQRATGDAFLQKYFTSNGGEVDSFHEVPHGLGLYDLVREFSPSIISLLPHSGRDRTLDISRGTKISF